MDDVVDESLSRFAYKTNLPASTPPLPRPSRPISVVRKDPPVHLPDSQLVSLSKCVACGLHWTSRKSARQKRTHIELCAKKHALTRDTVRFLVEKEVAPTASTKDLAENATATLMDSVVPICPVKKLRRQQVVPTVKSLPETRESILERARDVLGPFNIQEDSHPTQQFGQSALARRKTNRPALLDASGFIEEPPLTQPFGASSLCTKMMTGGRSVDRREQSSFLSTQRDSILSKRPISPPLAGGKRQRLQ